MVTLITRLLLLFQFLIVVALFLALREKMPGALALASSLGAVILFRLSLAANNFFLAWRNGSTTPSHCHLGLRDSLRLFAGEFRASMTSSSWTMPFLAFTRRTPSNPQGLPVLLIHGYGCNSGYWHAMSKVLLNAGITHHAVDMEPVFGGIDEYVPMIHEAAARLCADTGQDKIIILAHSMGGLAARAYLRVHGTARIAKVITLGTPHHGTALASFGIGLNTRQMHWSESEQESLSSEWLHTLAKEENPSIYRLFVSIYSHHDNIIAPQTSSHLEGARNIEFHGIGHVALASHPRIQTKVIDEIRHASDAQLAFREASSFSV